MTCVFCASASVLYARKGGHALYRCGTCGLVWVHPIPNSAGVYGEEYFSGASGGFGYVDYDADKKPMVRTFETYLARIRQHTEGKRLLDVGSATGFFLAIAKRLGFDVQGVELSAYAANRARKKGIPTITGTLADVPDASAFDVITMLDVLEHVPDPARELARARALLAEGGILVINTPDIGSWYARLMGTRWHLIVPPEHLFYFNRGNMRALLERKGFEVLSLTTIGKQFTLSYIFSMLFMWQKLPLWKFLSRACERTWLSRIALPINLGDNMFVMARKTINQHTVVEDTRP